MLHQLFKIKLLVYDRWQISFLQQYTQLLISRYGGSTWNRHIRRVANAYLLKVPDQVFQDDIYLDDDSWALYVPLGGFSLTNSRRVGTNTSKATCHGNHTQLFAGLVAPGLFQTSYRRNGSHGRFCIGHHHGRKHVPGSFATRVHRYESYPTNGHVIPKQKNLFTTIIFTNS